MTSLAGFRFLICLVGFQCLHTFSVTAAKGVRGLFVSSASWGQALLTSDTRFEQLAPLITKVHYMVPSLFFLFLFVCLLFKPSQQKRYPSGYVIRYRYPALLDTCHGCRSGSQRGYGSLCCCPFHSLEIPHLKIKGYQKLFLWHPTKLRSCSCTRKRDALDV